jgi:hypothetical protein
MNQTAREQLPTADTKQSPGTLRRALTAAMLYFTLVFAAGFVLGPVRVFLLEPWAGNTIAVLIEAPFLLAAIVWAERYVARRLHLSPVLADLLVMGGGAAVLVLLADFAIGVPLRGIAMADQLNYLATPAGRIYLILVTLFALAPAMLAYRRT